MEASVRKNIRQKGYSVCYIYNYTPKWVTIMRKVLIIEDDPIMGKVMQRIFLSEHYSVNLAVTAEAGIAACLKELPDLVLLDVMLPDGNGIDVCHHIKADPKLRHIPVIIVSGEAMSVDSKVSGLEAGAEDYVLKPFIPEELIERVAGILKRSLKPI
ncbi:MAG: hypothetical protein A2X32_08500 [Elusimicrobia bacterium GWC2_64_44]|nr:MAG: hypothetical protein A2X32_08500 [Elusimicrobia bacterium GWC2_64_44]